MTHAASLAPTSSAATGSFPHVPLGQERTTPLLRHVRSHVLRHPWHTQTWQQGSRARSALETGSTHSMHHA